MNRVMRVMQESDLSLVIDIENRAFTHPWPSGAFRDILTMRPWILEADGILCGYIFYHAIIDEAVILNFAIDPALQKQGHGEFLLISSIELLHSEGYKHFYLDVRKSNEPAINLYAKQGFMALGLRKKYYSNPDEDAIVMGLKLPSSKPEIQ